MKAPAALLLLALLLFGSGCAGEPEPAPELPPLESVEEPEPPAEEEAPDPSAEAPPPTPRPEELLPEGMLLVREGGAPAVRRGDFDGDGGEDHAYLAVRQEPASLRELGSQERLYAGRAAEERDPRILLLLASGEGLTVSPGPLLLLAEFETLPFRPDSPTAGGDPPGPEAPRGDLLYLRFETLEQQRHLLFAVHPQHKTLHRYLFITNTVTGLLVRDLDRDGVSDVAHVETRVSAAGIEESYYTLYRFRGRELNRVARVAVVERTNELLTQVRALILAGDLERLRRRYTVDPARPLESYFLPREGEPVSELGRLDFAYVPEVGSNPFNLTEPTPELRTEILLVTGQEEHIFSIRLGFLVDPEAGPVVRLLPLSD